MRAGVGGQLAESVPAGVSYAFERELLGPLTQWLLAYEVARVRRARVCALSAGTDGPDADLATLEVQTVVCMALPTHTLCLPSPTTQGFLADVQGKRLGYDAARRALVNRANRTTEAVVGKGASPGDQRLVQLAEDAAAASGEPERRAVWAAAAVRVLQPWTLSTLACSRCQATVMCLCPLSKPTRLRTPLHTACAAHPPPYVHSHAGRV
jgi:hypothetical protein